MRILLIQAYLGRREPPVAPLGLASLAAHLPRHEVKIFDPNIAANPLKDTADVIEDFQPELIGLSLRNIDTTKYSDQYFYFEHFQEYVRFVKGVGSQVLIVVGGGAFSLFPRRIMERTPEIDIGFYCEAEVSFPRFVYNNEKVGKTPGIYFRKDDKIEFTGLTPPVNVGELLPPAWDLVDIAAYIPFTDKASIGIETKRGCGMKCAYCTYPQLGGDTLRKKSASKVVDEMEVLRKKHGVDRVFFCDPVFNYPPHHAESICREITRRGLEIKWRAYHQDRFLTREYITLARESGCDDFYLSPDSASAKGLRTLGKASTVESLNRSLDLIADDGKAGASYNFFGAVPGTGWRNFLAAALFILKAKVKLGKRFTRYKFSYIRLEPNTPLAKKVYGEKAEDEWDFLLPANSKDLNRLFHKKSTSFLLNILLFLHFYIGKLWGRRNVIEG